MSTSATLSTRTSMVHFPDVPPEPLIVARRIWSDVWACAAASIAVKTNHLTVLVISPPPGGRGLAAAARLPSRHAASNAGGWLLNLRCDNAVVDSFCHASIIMPMTTMNISLPQELKEYIEQQSKTGYSTPSEYVRELIRGDQKRRARERLDTLLLEGLDSGEPLPATPAFWDELKREALAKLSKKSKA
jgi:antitoxin ParD1/3/4